jgi:polyphosphate kinase
MDLKSYSRWYDYSRARDAMFAATDTAWAPWYIADADDKKRARLNIISHLLSQIPYKPSAHRDITLPKRQKDGGYVQPDLPLRHIPNTVLEDRQASPHMYAPMADGWEEF